jgi:hypothetical protein
MKRNIYLKAVVEIFVIASLLVSCSVKETNNTAAVNRANEFITENVDVTIDPQVDETQDIKLPDIIELHYKGIELDGILQAGDLTSLKKVKDEQLGKVYGEQINISLYSDNDNNIHGVFKHQGKEFILNYLGYAHDLESVEIYELQLVYNTDGKNLVLVSGIGSSILGYQYIIFDESNNKWTSFHNWGTPQAIDINHDGIKEVFLQFHGMHLHTPDLNIFSFQDGRFRVVDINSEVYRDVKLDLTNSKIGSTYIKEQDNKALVEISDLMGNEAPFLYHLEFDEMNSSLLRLRKEIQNIQLNK